jgi:hypothetical protein
MISIVMYCDVLLCRELWLKLRILLPLILLCATYFKQQFSDPKRCCCQFAGTRAVTDYEIAGELKSVAGFTAECRFCSLLKNSADTYHGQAHDSESRHIYLRALCAVSQDFDRG